ncbi:phenylalanine--tRNA ligase subunit beta, partial [Candidatus Bathyarchaeota archaeon]
MPTIEIYREDLEGLLGMRLPSDVEELDEILSYVKGEVKLIDEEELTIELQDTNRPDLWCVEGLARALRGFLGIETGLKRYKVAGESGVEVLVDERLKTIRPYIACSVVKEVEIDDKVIRQLMHLQDKMDQTYGRQRRRTSIGLYNFDLVTPPLRYGVSKPDEVSFVPLEFEEELTLREILEKHPKGIEYGHIVRHHPVWPIFMDSKGKVLSFPPIINSNDLGRITEETRNVLVEVTGTSFETVLYTLTNITLSLADRGGVIYSAKIHYPYEGGMEVTTPKLETETLNIEVDYIRGILGIDLKPTEIVELLEKARYGVVNADSRSVTVEVPCYRVDIMHPIDVVEDIAIAYNYNKIKPRWPQLSTVGGKSPDAGLRDAVREIMIGLGYQEILSFTMTNLTKLFGLMNIEPTKVVEVSNPKISYLTCLRNWLLPSLMEFLSHNLHVEYPQRIFEVGYCVVYDQEVENKTKDVEKLACATAHSNASFTEARSTLDALLRSLGLEFQVEEVEHGSFIDGRVGKIVINGKDVGLIGEVHPQVLENWGLE